VVALWAPLAAPARAADPEEAAAIPTPAELEAAGAVIGTIEIVNPDAFDPTDPKEDDWLFRAANALHPVTRAHVIERMLLFHSGEPFRARLLEESERILREQRYLYDAWIEPVRYQDGKVDVRVRTRDVWTLTPGLSFAREGGVNTYRVGIEDSNFLGFGKELTARYGKEIDRTEMLYRYRDPAVLGSRVVLEASYADNSDGYGRLLYAARPFYALDTRWAASGALSEDDRVVSLYDRGEVFAKFDQRTDFVELWGGIGGRSGRGVVARWRYGFTYDDRRFGPDPGGGAIPPEGIPEDRTLAYPWISVQWFQDRFGEVHNFDRLVRTEDLYLGEQFEVRAGWSDPAFGADDRRALGYFDWRRGAVVGGRLFWFAAARTSGRYGDGRTENWITRASARTLLRHAEHWAFVAQGSGEVARRLDPESQILLGGDTGLRGYPVRYARGDRKWLVSLEERLYTDIDLFRLLNVGAAAFVDVGHAWFDDDDAEDLGVLSNVGVGLRLGSSRSSRGAMLHVDFAVAIGAPDDVDDFQIAVSSRESF